MNTINQRIKNISECTVEELFGFLVVIMADGETEMSTRDLSGIETAIQLPGVQQKRAGLLIVHELKSRSWKTRDLSRDRIADHAIGVQCTDVCNLMVGDDEVLESSTLIKSIIEGPPCGN